MKKKKKPRRRGVTERVGGRWRQIKSRNGGENKLFDCRERKLKEEKSMKEKFIAYLLIQPN